MPTLWYFGPEGRVKPALIGKWFFVRPKPNGEKHLKYETCNVVPPQCMRIPSADPYITTYNTLMYTSELLRM